jgi:uncharacterized protein YprB with RNaseH-like and TPR domain
MLEKTFCHIPGISLKTEQALWEQGITHWDHFCDPMPPIAMLPPSKIEEVKQELAHSRRALASKDIRYFKQLLDAKQHWRLAPHAHIAFVDIETTGLSRWHDEITMIGIYDGVTAEIYVQGQNLQAAHERLKSFDLFVTYNGKQFDIPFIETHFEAQYEAAHLDLRYLLREFGLQGGLKSIERQLGISRHTDVASIDGFEAVRLWRRYQKGDQQALHRLMQYNKEDIVNLKTLLDFYLQNKQARPH